MPRRADIPNLLTVARVVMACVVIALVCLARPGSPLLIAALALFIIAALTDALDGYLARRWSVQSVFGRVMDPAADKLLVVGTLVALLAHQYGAAPAGPSQPASGLAPWMVVIVVWRELLVTAARSMSERLGIDASADWTGKAKVIVQMIGIAGILMSLTALADHPATMATLNGVIAWTITIVTLISGVPMVQRLMRGLAMSEQA